MCLMGVPHGRVPHGRVPHSVHPMVVYLTGAYDQM
jgi:hypothetical protein